MSAKQVSKTVKGRATKNTTKGKAATETLDSEDERLRTVARHLAYILFHDATPSDVHNHLYEYVVGLEEKYLRFIKSMRPERYAEHLFHVLKHHEAAKGGRDER